VQNFILGCGEGKLSCSDGKTGLSSTNCINLSQKCDGMHLPIVISVSHDTYNADVANKWSIYTTGHIDCPNSKDEKDCWRLTSFDLKVTESCANFDDFSNMTNVNCEV